MSLPTSNANGQSSIRNFFRPKQPAYAPPPSTAASRPQQTSPVPPPPPPATATATANATATGTPSRPSPPSPSNNSNTKPPPALHPQASISAILPEHVPALRRITSLLLPVNYPDSFYARLSDPQSSGAFSRVVLWRDDDAASSAAPKVIGGLVCRPEPSPFHPSSPTSLGGTSIFQQMSAAAAVTSSSNALYIQSLVLLSPYRGLGLAAALLDDVTAAAAAAVEGGGLRCDTVYAHVWTENADGLRWYLARGFAQATEVKGYYFKLRPDSAWVVRRDIIRTGGNSSSSTSSTLGFGGANAGVTVAGKDGGPGTSATAAAANLPLNTTTSTTTTPPVLAASSLLSPPPPRSPAGSGSGSGAATPSGRSFQNARPETEWNDLPADMHVSRSASANGDRGATTNNNNLGIPTTTTTTTGTGGGSGTSSRSSSTGRKKRDRAYPAAAFGS